MVVSQFNVLKLVEKVLRKSAPLSKNKVKILNLILDSKPRSMIFLNISHQQILLKLTY
jgi:hypothetical protein